MELSSAATSSTLSRKDDDQDDLGAPGGGGGHHPGPEQTRATPASPGLRCRRISDRSCGARPLIRSPGHSLVPATSPLQVGVVQRKMATGRILALIHNLSIANLYIANESLLSRWRDRPVLLSSLIQTSLSTRSFAGELYNVSNLCLSNSNPPQHHRQPVRCLPGDLQPVAVRPDYPAHL